MLNNNIKELQSEFTDNCDLQEYNKKIHIQLTKDDVNKILNDLQNIIFVHKINTDDVLAKIKVNGISPDVLEAVATMMSNSKNTYDLIAKCYDVNVINCFIYVLLKTLQIFMKSRIKKHRDYAVLIIDRYLNDQTYETDNDYELKRDIDQSSFSRRKKNALTAFAMRLNAEFNSLYCSEIDIKDEKDADNDCEYPATFDFLFAGVDISPYMAQLNTSIFGNRLSR